MQSEYDPKQIEQKWQKVWAESGIYEAKTDSQKPEYYSLIEFPYPSGDGLHVGHPRPYIGMDVISRKRRMQGYNVLYPIGWDAFGLPTENYAIKTGRKPAEITKENTDTFRRQIQSLGVSFDWSREINTTDPRYYKWTQWLFLKFLEHGLAYKSKAFINWCPKDKIGLANEEVVDGKCERCGTPVEKREKEQWMLAITKYAERLDKDLDTVDYPERVKAQQRNWIGRSEGAEIDFALTNGEKITVFTTRPDTIFGATFIAIAPQVAKQLTGKDFGIHTDTDRENKEKLGVDTGIKAKNPANGEEIPVWVVNYVSADYGTGAIMGVPAHDERDYIFAKKHNLPIKGVVIPVLPDVSNPHVPGKEIVFRRATINVIYDPKTDRYLTLHWKKQPWITYVTGGVEDGEDPIDSAKREIAEETGYTDVRFVRKLGSDAQAEFYAAHKGVNRVAHNSQYLWELVSDAQNERTQEEKEQFDVVWVPAAELEGLKIQHSERQLILDALKDENSIYTGGGVLINSGNFSGRKTSNGAEPAPRYIDSHDPPLPGVKTVKKKVAHAIIESPDGKSVLVLKWHNFGWVSFVSGGVDDGEEPIEALKREVREETGYTDIETIKSLGAPFFTEYHAAHKGENREAEVYAFHVKLASEKQEGKAKFDNEKFDDVWVSWDEARKIVNQVEAPEFWKRLDSEDRDVKKDIAEAVGGTWVTKFKLRDWIFSRQRYWGEPIPVIHCPKCGTVPVPEQDLPVLLPDVENYQPTETGESPLTNISEWVNTTCPKCNGAAKRETDVMPNWAGSSWYFLRYTDPHNDKAFASNDALKYWMPVDWYNGGMEHTTLHLLYSRFWNKFFFDIGLVPVSEPYKKRTSHGLVLAEGGEKMSKSKGNVVNPDAVVAMFGADSLRVYEMFMGPFEQAIAWSESSLVGTRRFLERVWKLREKVSDTATVSSEEERIMHETIKKISEDIETLGFNTAVSALMSWVNALDKKDAVSREEYRTLIMLLAPFAPHISEELWSEIGEKDSVHEAAWPSYDEAKLAKTFYNMAAQVNGKLRATFQITSSATEEEVKSAALELPEVKKWLNGATPKKVVVVLGRVVNIVV